MLNCIVFRVVLDEVYSQKRRNHKSFHKYFALELGLVSLPFRALYERLTVLQESNLFIATFLYYYYVILAFHLV